MIKFIGKRIVDILSMYATLVLFVIAFEKLFYDQQYIWLLVLAISINGLSFWGKIIKEQKNERK